MIIHCDLTGCQKPLLLWNATVTADGSLWFHKECYEKWASITYEKVKEEEEN